MAKKSAVQKNMKRERMVGNQSAKRAELKAIIKDKSVSDEERFMAVLKLSEMPRDGSKIRVRNRCELTGRPRGVYRKFKLGRIAMRDLANQGQIPGIVKSSW